MNNDLISREALKEELELSKYITPTDLNRLLNSEINRCIEAIDNAPTVESEPIDILYLCDHKKCGENFNCFECNHTSDIRHAINFDLMEFPRSVFVERARPQGKWVLSDISDRYYCPFCGNDSICHLLNEPEPFFCSFCGAELRGSEEE